MCPTGLCFTPRLDIKRSIDIFGETQGAHALGIEINLDEKTALLRPNGGALLRLSPIAYFYNQHSQEKRSEIIEDCCRRMFGKQTSTQIFCLYIELLVKAINGLSKQEILQSIQFQPNSNDIFNRIFSNLIFILENDENNLDKGIQLASTMLFDQENESNYLNPFDSNRSIVLTLYLQLISPIYNQIPQQYQNEIYAKETLEYLIKWISYQKQRNLLSI